MAKGTTLISPMLGPLLMNAAMGITALAPLNALSRWLEHLSPLTRRAYAADLRDLAQRCGMSNEQVVERLIQAGPTGTNSLLDAWLTELKREGLSTATRARRLSSVRALLKFLRLVGLITWTVEIHTDRVDHEDMRGPSPDAWKTMLEHVHALEDPWLRTRTTALVYLLGVCGLRVGEALGIAVPEDVNEERLRITGKGKSAAEWIAMPPLVATAVAAWLTWRGPRPGALFIAKSAGPQMRALVHSSVYRQLLRLGHQVDQQLSIRPHGLRHRAITKALDITGGDVRRVMKFSRHRSVATVLRYDDERRGSEIAADIAQQIGAL